MWIRTCTVSHVSHVSTCTCAVQLTLQMGPFANVHNTSPVATSRCTFTTRYNTLFKELAFICFAFRVIHKTMWHACCLAGAQALKIYDCVTKSGETDNSGECSGWGNALMCIDLLDFIPGEGLTTEMTTEMPSSATETQLEFVAVGFDTTTTTTTTTTVAVKTLKSTTQTTQTLQITKTTQMKTQENKVSSSSAQTTARTKEPNKSTRPTEKTAKEMPSATTGPVVQNAQTPSSPSTKLDDVRTTVPITSQAQHQTPDNTPTQNADREVGVDPAMKTAATCSSYVRPPNSMACSMGNAKQMHATNGLYVYTVALIRMSCVVSWVTFCATRHLTI